MKATRPAATLALLPEVGRRIMGPNPNAIQQRQLSGYHRAWGPLPR